MQSFVLNDDDDDNNNKTSSSWLATPSKLRARAPRQQAESPLLRRATAASQQRRGGAAFALGVLCWPYRWLAGQRQALISGTTVEQRLSVGMGATSALLLAGVLLLLLAWPSLFLARPLASAGLLLAVFALARFIVRRAALPLLFALTLLVWLPLLFASLSAVHYSSPQPGSPVPSNDRSSGTPPAPPPPSPAPPTEQHSDDDEEEEEEDDDDRCDPFLGCDATIDKFFSPTAFISGGGTICLEEYGGRDIRAQIDEHLRRSPIELVLSMTGQGPWNLVYHEAGTQYEYHVSGIQSSPFHVRLLADDDNNDDSAQSGGSLLLRSWSSHRIATIGEHTFQLGAAPSLTSPLFDHASGPWLSSSSPPPPATAMKDRFCPLSVYAGAASIAVLPVPRLPDWQLLQPACPGANGTSELRFGVGKPAEEESLRDALVRLRSAALTSDSAGAVEWTTKLTGASMQLSLAAGWRHCIVSITSQGGCSKRVADEAPLCLAVPALAVPSLHVRHASADGAAVEQRYCRSSASSERRVDLALEGAAPWQLVYRVNGTLRTVATDDRQLSLDQLGSYELVSLSDRQCAVNLSQHVVLSLDDSDNVASLAAAELCVGDDVVVRLEHGRPPWSLSLACSDGRPPIRRSGVTGGQLLVRTDRFANAAVQCTLEWARDALCPATLQAPTVVQLRARPSAHIALHDELDAGSRTAALLLLLTGAAPWRVDVVHGPAELPFASLTTDEPRLLVPVEREGVYRVAALTDASGCAALPHDLSGEARLHWPARPTVSVTPAALVQCEGDDNADSAVVVTMTGTAPYSFELVHDSGDAQRFERVTAGTLRLPLTVPGVYAVRSFRDRHYQLPDSDVAATVTVSIRQAPSVRWLRAHNVSRPCADSPATELADVQFDGTPPFTLVYSIDGADRSTELVRVSGIDGWRYALPLLGEGVYTLVEVVDSAGCRQTASAAIALQTPAALSCSWLRPVCCALHHVSEPAADLAQALLCRGGRPPYTVTYRSSCGGAGSTTTVAAAETLTPVALAGLFDRAVDCTVSIESVSDAHGCRAPPSTAAFLIAQAGGVALRLSGSAQLCDDVSNFALDVAAAGSALALPYRVELLAADSGHTEQFELAKLGATSLAVRQAGTYSINWAVDRHHCPVAVDGGAVTVSRYRPLMAWIEQPAGTGPIELCANALPLRLTVQLLGQPPWNLTWSDGVETHSAAGIEQPVYEIRASRPGVYSLLDVYDAHCHGVAQASHHELVVLPIPTVQISGGGVICDDGSSSTISLQLTGTPPWSLLVKSNTGASLEINDVRQPFYSFQSTDAGTYYVESIQDALCSYRRKR